ncbi:TMEM175 family protein, partial [Acinetobacter baumannii]
HLRHRRDSSRLEAFSDGVFGLAVTLLVASQQVPSTFTGLMQLGQQIIPAALSFGILFGLWYSHCKFFRRYPLEDDVTLRLNGLF